MTRGNSIRKRRNRIYILLWYKASRLSKRGRKRNGW
jgi:hypothetical protein